MVHRLHAGSSKSHAAFHLAVETQAATGFEPTVRALERLRGQGLNRHDAIHAIGSVLAAAVWEESTSQHETESAVFQAHLNAAIERLDGKQWLKEHGK